MDYFGNEKLKRAFKMVNTIVELGKESDDIEKQVLANQFEDFIIEADKNCRLTARVQWNSERFKQSLFDLDHIVARMYESFPHNSTVYGQNENKNDYYTIIFSACQAIYRIMEEIEEEA